VTVRNNGPDAAPDMRLTDTINAPVKVVSVRASQGSCQRRIPMRCRLGTIAAGETVTSKMFRVKVRAARGANGRKVNTATVRSPDVRRRARARDRVMVRGVAAPVTG
jgi:hypothetical protein